MTQGNGTIRYEAKGNKGRAIVLFVMAAILFVCSIVAFQEADRKGLSINGRRMAMYTEESRQLWTSMGWAGLLGAVFFVGTGIGMLRCEVTIYDDHVEGQAYSLTSAKKRFSFLKESVQSIEQFSGGVTIIGGGQKCRIMCERSEETFSQLQQWQTEIAAPTTELEKSAPVDDGRVKCPKCGTMQRRVRDACYMCRTPLPKD